ncbi:hypothetical protein GCM10009127_23530 [Alteraurantiacibacter aestuarii]
MAMRMQPAKRGLGQVHRHAAPVPPHSRAAPWSDTRQLALNQFSVHVRITPSCVGDPLPNGTICRKEKTNMVIMGAVR